MDKPDGYYGPEESMRPDSEPKKEETDINDDYFNPGKVYLDHKARCEMVQRRGHHLRLQRVMDNFIAIGSENLLDGDRDTFDVVQKELTKVETLMRDAGQEP